MNTAKQSQNNHKFLAFDLGATSGRAIIGSVEGGRIVSEEVYRFPNAVTEKDGKFYWDIDALFGHFKAALGKVGQMGVAIDSIGIDTWGVDFGFVGEDGELLGSPRAYRDPYTDGIPEEVFKIIPKEELYGITGMQILNFNTIFQIYAQLKEEDGPIRKAKKLLFVPDLLSYLLTGEMVCEYTIASTSGMINPRTRGFEGSILERVGCSAEMFPKLVQPGTKVGLLKKEIAEQAGLPRIPVIAVAGHDTASAIAAVPAQSEGFAYLSSGTWSLMGIESAEPIINSESMECNITNEGGIEGTTRFLKNITGMWLLEQARKHWEAEGRKYSYPEMEAMSRKAEGFASTVDPDDPRFAAPKEMYNEICKALEESGQPVPQNDGEMIRCIYNSLTTKYKTVLAMFQSFASFKIEKLHVIGGGSANKTVSQMTADALGIPVLAGPVEGTAIGNIMIQAREAGLVKDRWEMREIIKNSIEVKEYLPSTN